MSTPVSRTAHIHINAAKAEQTLERLKSRSEKLSKAIEEGNKEGKDMTEQMKKLGDTNSKVKELEGIISGKLAPSVRMVQSHTRDLHRELSNMSKDTPGYAAKFRAYEEASKHMRVLKQDVDKVSLAMRAQNKATSIFSNVKSIAAGVLIGNTVQAGVDRLLGYINGLVTGNAQLSDILADVEKNTGMSAAQVQRLNKELAKIDTRTARKELLSIASALGKLGQDVSKEAIENIDKIVVALGDDFEGDASSITKELSVLRNNLHDIKSNNYADDILHIGNAINELSANGLASAPVLVDISNRVSGVAQTFGVTSAQILGTAATFEELGIKTEKGSTAFIRILQNMTKNVGEYAKVAEYAGVTQKEFVNLVNTDIIAALMAVAKGSKIAGDNNVRFGQILQMLDADGSGAGEVLSKLSQNTELYTEKIKLAGESLQQTGSITDEFNKKNNIFAGILQKIEKRIMSAFTNSAMMQGLSSLSLTFAELIGAVEKTNKSLDEFEKQKEKVAELDKNLDPLIDRIDELKKQSSLSEVEQVELRKAIEDLGAAMPYAITQFDNYGKAMDISTGKAKEFIRQQRLAMRVLNESAITDQQDAIDESIKQLHFLNQFPQQKSYGKSYEEWLKIEYDKTGDAKTYAKKLANHNARLQQLAAQTAAQKQKLEGQLVQLANLSGKTYEQVLQENEKYQIALNTIVIPAPNGATTKKTPKAPPSTTNNSSAPILSDEEKKKIEAEAKRLKADQERLLKEIEKLVYETNAIGKSSTDALKVDLDRKRQLIEQKYKELIQMAHGNVVLLAQLDELQQKELSGLLDNFLKDQAATEYDESLKQLDTYYLQVRAKNDQAFADGTINTQQYYDRIRQIDREQNEDRLTITKDYAATSIKAAKDLETAKTDALKQGIADRKQALQNEVEDRNNDLQRAVVTSKLGTKQRLDAEIALITEKYRQEIELNRGNNAKRLLLESELNNKIADLKDQKFKSDIAKSQALLSALGNLYSNYMSYVTQQTEQQLAQELAVNQRKQDSLDRLLEDKKISEETYNRQKAQNEEEAHAREEAINKKLFRQRKTTALSQAAIDGALSITGIWASYGANPILAGILTAVAAAATFAQVATISSQKYKSYGKGGMLDGPSHSENGMPVINPRTGQKVMEVEGGEAILSKETVLNNRKIVNDLLHSSMYQNGKRIAMDWVSGDAVRLNTDMLGSTMAYNNYMAKGGIVASASMQLQNNGTSAHNPSSSQNDVALLAQQMKRLNDHLDQGITSKVVYKDLKKAEETYNALRDISKLSA